MSAINSVIITALVIAVCTASRAEVLRYHTLATDADGKIVPWFTPAANAFDNYLDQCWAWALTAPNDTHGLPISYLYCAWHPGSPPTADTGWENDVGEKIPNWVESARLYYQYSGNRAALDYVKGLVDYSLAHGQTPTNHVWPAFPVGTSNAGDTEFRGFSGPWSLWDCHVDLAADIGFSMYRMFQVYGDAKYRDKAIHVADVLATNMVAGSATNSPWPYVVNSQTGLGHSPYAASWDGALELFDLLIANNHGNVSNYISARATLKNWLLTYPMRNGNWVDGHSDVGINGTNNWSATCASDMCLYEFDNPTWDPDFQTNALKLIKWAEDNFVNVSTPDGLTGQYHGAYVPAEQTAYLMRMGYQTARLGAQYAQWYAVSGDVAYKDRAYRCFAYNTYMMQDNGQSSDGPTDGVGYWWSDCYGEATRMYYYGMAAFPEWAPPDENHLLRSSSVVKSIAYTNASIVYTTWDNAATELFRLASVPTNVLAGGVALPQLTSLTDEGWAYDQPAGVLRVRHSATNQIHVLLDPSTFQSVATVAFDGSQTYQTIDGYGVNINAGWWNSGEVRPAIDLLADQAGASIFRAVIEEMDWEALNDNASPTNFNWTYYNTVYTNAHFQGVWNTLRYLNQKGITNGLVISFMGQPPAWMGPNSTVSSTNNDEFVETMASLLYYARNTAGVQFNLISPLNETDTGGVEGPSMGATQFAGILHKLAVKLDAIGMSDVRVVAPETAFDWSSFFNVCVADPVIMAKLACWGIHQYGGDASGYQNTINGTAYPNKPCWVTETATFSTLLSQVKNRPTANLVWDGFDSIYQHAIRAGRGSTPPNDSPGIDPPLIAYNTSTHLYTPRTSFYQHAQLFKFVRPGAQRIGWSGTSTGFSSLEAFRDPNNGQFTIVGINTNSGSVSLHGTLAAVPGVEALDLFYTSAATNLAPGRRYAVSGGAFTAAIPPGCVFTLVSSSASLTTSLTSPGIGATFTSPALIPLAAVTFGGSNAVASVEFIAGTTKIGADTIAPYAFTWTNVPVGTYTLVARAMDVAGGSVTSMPVTITVAAPGGAAVLGSANEGTTTDTITDGSGAYINACRFQAANSATVTALKAKVGAISGRYKLAVYADNGGQASALLRQTATLTNAVSGWNEFPLASPLNVISGTYYWFAIWSDDVAARIYAINGGSECWAVYPFGVWPDPVNLGSSSPLTYSIYAAGPATTAFDQWKSNYGLAPSVADASGDGQSLLLEYALGLNPLARSGEGLPTGGLRDGYLTLTYRKAKAATDILCEAEAANALTGLWSSAADAVEQVWMVREDLTHQTITARDRTAVTNAPSRFMRLRVSEP